MDEIANPRGRKLENKILLLCEKFAIIPVRWKMIFAYYFYTITFLIHYNNILWSVD